MKLISMHQYKRIKYLFLSIIVGLIYAGFVSFTGYGVPCLFKVVTGWDCPGCGITRMLVSILHGNLYEAFHVNPVLFCLIPYILFRVVTAAKKWKVLRITDYSCVVILLAWGIIRNMNWTVI